MAILRKIYPVAGVVLALISISGCPRSHLPLRTSAADAASMQPHLAPGRVYDPQEGFSLVPPTGYRSSDNQPHLMSFLGPGEEGFTVNLNVTVQKDDGTPIEKAASKVKGVLPLLLREYVSVEEGFVTLGGRKAYYTSGRFNWKGVDVQNLQYVVKGGNGHVYVLTFASRSDTFGANRPVFEQCARTVLIQ